MINKDFPLISNYAIQSDVSGDRDGIGIEVLEREEILLEIFRDDTKKERQVTLYKRGLSLDLIEESIKLFRKDIPQDFIKYEE